MKIEQIKKLLHQREPYLMPTEVIDINSKQITAVKQHSGDEFYIKGHFPGAPVVPGAMLQELCTQSAGILITKFYSPVPDYDSSITKGWALGVLNKVELSKFFDFSNVDDDLIAKVELIDHHEQLFKFRASVFQNSKLKAKFRFNLVNIREEYIQDI